MSSVNITRYYEEIWEMAHTDFAQKGSQTFETQITTKVNLLSL